MSPEQLEKLILESTPASLAESLQDLDEPARRRLSKTASSLFTRIRRGDFESRRRGLLSGSRNQRHWTNASIAMLGVCPLSQVKRADWFQDYLHRDALVKILGDRRPDWVDDWVDHCLAQDFPLIQWQTVSELMDRGVCNKPGTPGYTALFAHGYNAVNFRNKDDYVPLGERLAARPDLLQDEIWRLFESEHNAFAHDHVARSTNAPEGYETWPCAIAALSQRELLDRDRLLDACISALWVSTNSPILSGFQAVHDQLSPTDADLCSRQAAYRELLGHQIAHVVGFALKQLTRIEKAGALDVDALVAALPPVFALGQKSHPMTALRLLQRIAKKQGKPGKPAAMLLLDALRHPAGDVQERAVDILEAHAGELGDELRDQLCEELGEVGARARARLAELLGSNIEASARAQVQPEASGTSTLIDAIRCLDPGHRERFLIDEQDLVRVSLPAPVPYACVTLGSLDRLEPLAPIEDVDGLIDAVAHAIEVVESVDQIERIIDGMSRLCGERPAGFAERVAPLVKRIQSSQGSEISKGLAGSGVPASLCDLVLTWLTGTRVTSKLPGFMFLRGPVRFIHARLRELASSVQAGRAGGLLSAPTHCGGWIAPAALVERARSANGSAPLATDVVQALLRLSRDGASEAMGQASDVQGPLGCALRLALGADRPETAARQVPASWWLAAARSRWPRQDLHERLEGLGISVDWPDVLTPAHYAFNTYERSSTALGNEYSHKHIKVSVTPELGALLAEPEASGSRIGRLVRQVGGHIARGTRLARQRVQAGQLDLGTAFPTALFHEHGGNWWNNAGNQQPWLVEWQASVWPANTDGFFVRGVRAMDQRMDMNSATMSPNHAYLTPLFEPDRPWTEMAALAATVALTSKDSDCRRLAIDALIDGIADTRAHALVLAPVVNALQEHEWMKLNRLASSLGEVARISPLHQLVCAQILEAWLGARDTLPRSAHHVLELLHELLVDLDRGLPAQARPALKAMKGSSKTAKLARLLLARDGVTPGAGEREAVALAIQARLVMSRLP